MSGQKLWKKAIITKDYVRIEDDDREIAFKYDAVEVIRKMDELAGLLHTIIIHKGGVKYTVNVEHIERDSEYKALTSFFIRADLNIKPKELESLDCYIIKYGDDVLAIGKNWIFHGVYNESELRIYTECIEEIEQRDPLELSYWTSIEIDVSDNLEITVNEEGNCYTIRGIKRAYSGTVGIAIDPARKELIDEEMIKLVLRRGTIQLIRPM